jgi:hypothetical protein
LPSISINFILVNVKQFFFSYFIFYCWHNLYLLVLPRRAKPCPSIPGLAMPALPRQSRPNHAVPFLTCLTHPAMLFSK